MAHVRLILRLKMDYSAEWAGDCDVHHKPYFDTAISFKSLNIERPEDQMQQAEKSASTDFDEWMITKALASHLGERGKENDENMTWLFNLEAATRQGSLPLFRLCGFNWDSGMAEGASEASFRKDSISDRGRMSEEEFNAYWSITPDFRYWTRGTGEKQLIIEAKGTDKPSG